MTIKDIARESGYAVGTVSRVLNGHPNVSPEAREKILAVVRQNKFRLNSNAKRLKQQASHSIAVVVKGSRNLLFATLLETAQSLVETRGYSVILSYHSEEENEVAVAQALCAEHKPMGVLFLGGNRENFRRDFAAMGPPCVLVTTPAGDLGFPNLSSVTTDDVLGARAAANYLLDAGHTRVGVIGAEAPAGGSNSSQLRFSGFCQALADRGVLIDPEAQCVPARYSLEGGYAGARTLLERGGGISAIFAMSDVMAIGAMRAARDMGLSVPGDLSIMGYDGIELGAYCHPKLTTVRQDGDALARRSVDILLAAIEENAPAVHEIVPFDLVAGESVGRLEQDKREKDVSR